MFKFNIQLFAESGEASSDAMASPGAAESVDSQTSPDDDRARQYAEFKNQFKAEYNAEVQGIIKDRLKNSTKQTNELKGRIKSLAPIIEHMAKQYNVDANDLDGLVKAFENDDSLLEDEAYEQGLSVEQLRNLKNLERENERLKAEEQERIKQATMSAWDEQIQATKQFYPNFDFEAESQNPEFLQLMDAGLNIKRCYEIIHQDEIMAGAMGYAVQQTASKVSNSIKANGNRPNPNGLGSSSASLQKVDFSQMSLAEMQEYVRRSNRGEHITFT